MEEQLVPPCYWESVSFAALKFSMGARFLNYHHAHQPLCTFPSLILKLFIPTLAFSFFRSYFGLIVEINQFKIQVLAHDMYQGIFLQAD